MGMQAMQHACSMRFPSAAPQAALLAACIWGQRAGACRAPTPTWLRLSAVSSNATIWLSGLRDRVRDTNAWQVSEVTGL